MTCHPERSEGSCISSRAEKKFGTSSTEFTETPARRTQKLSVTSVFNLLCLVLAAGEPLQLGINILDLPAGVRQAS